MLHNFEGAKLSDDDKVEEDRPLYLADFMEKLVGNSARSDCTFVVADGTSSREVHAHRLILAASSPLFKAMLYPPESEKEKTKLPIKVEIKGCTHDEFLSFLQCIYTDETDVGPDNLEALINLSNKYQIEKLQVLCQKYMEKDVSVETACDMFEKAPRLLGREDFAIGFIRENADEILQTQAFYNLSPSRLEYLLKDDKMDVDEVALFKAVLEWGKQTMKRGGPKGLELKGSEDEKTKALLKPLMQYIRFPLMTVEDLVAFVTPTNLLDEAHSVKVFQYVSQPSDDEKAKIVLPFNTKPRGDGISGVFTFAPSLNFSLSEKDRKFTRNGSTGWNANILSAKPMNKKQIYTWAFKITQTAGSGEHMVGIGPSTTNKTGSNYSQNGFYMYLNTGTLYSGPPFSYSSRSYRTQGRVNVGSTVQCTLDLKSSTRTLSFAVDGVNHGVAYSGIPEGNWFASFDCYQTCTMEFVKPTKLKG